MTQVTVRGIEEGWVSQAKAVARERGVSMNSVLKEAIAKGLGVGEEKKTNGLEKFAGSLADQSEEESRFWEKFLKEDLNEIHPDDWK